jgi:inner membrane protein involved in colicin E2 resistance
MDQLLSLILALLSFVLMIFMISRAVKYIILLGLALVAFFVLTTLGILRW